MAQNCSLYLNPCRDWKRGRRIGFIQQEIVPRRNALYDAFQQITESHQAALQKSEIAFADKRQDAVRRLLLMLGLCVVLGLLVAGVSLRHAKRLERETSRQYAEVARAKREMEHLSARLLETEEESRRWLARELHDEIGQTLAVLEIEVSHAHSLTDETQSAIRDRLRRAPGPGRENRTNRAQYLSFCSVPPFSTIWGSCPALQWLLEELREAQWNNLRILGGGRAGSASRFG